MFIQDERLEEQTSFEVVIPTGKFKKEIFSQHIFSSLYHSRKRGNPEANPGLEILISENNSVQKKRLFIHSLIRMSEEYTVPKPLPAYSGFQTLINEPLPKYKAYFHVTLPDPPKKDVIYNVMVRCEQAVTYKNMPCIQLVGDQPVYALINEVKYENPEKFKHVLPVLGGFHIQCTFMATIY